MFKMLVSKLVLGIHNPNGKQTEMEIINLLHKNDNNDNIKRVGLYN